MKTKSALTSPVRLAILNKINGRRLIKYEKNFFPWEFHK